MTSSWQRISGGVTAPRGFLAAGITAGLKPSGNPDLSLLLAPEGAVCAGSFTTSLVRAACVDLCAERLQLSGGHARAVLTNSGQANACTGERGLADSLTATAELAGRLGLQAEQVLICSTGVIGVPIPIDTLVAGLDPLVAALSPAGGEAAARAILTTDLVEKQIALEARLDGLIHLYVRCRRFNKCYKTCHFKCKLHESAIRRALSYFIFWRNGKSSS